MILGIKSVINKIDSSTQQIIAIENEQLKNNLTANTSITKII